MASGEHQWEGPLKNKAGRLFWKCLTCEIEVFNDVKNDVGGVYMDVDCPGKLAPVKRRYGKIL